MPQFPQKTVLIEALTRARAIAREYPHSSLEPLHLFKAILVPKDAEAVQVLELARVNIHEVRAKLDAFLLDLPLAPHSTQPPPPSGSLQAVLQQIDLQRQVDDADRATDVHALLTLAGPDGGLPREKRTQLNIPYNALLQAVREFKSAQSYAAGPERPSPRKAAGATIEYCDDLTQRAQHGELDPVLGRDQEIARLAEILARRRKNNPLIIGEPGTGKTALVEGLAQLLVSDRAPAHLKGVRLFRLDLAEMVAGAKYKGEFEERLKGLLKEFAVRGNGAILFVDEIHSLLGVGRGGGGMDAANMLKPPLARGEIRLIGITTQAEYRESFEKDEAFARRFVTLRVEEPTDAVTQGILEGLAPIYAKHHRVEFTPEALQGAIRLSRRFVTNRFLPDKAVDLLDEAGADVSILAQSAAAWLETAPETEPASRRDFEEALRVRGIPLPAEDGEEAKRGLARRFAARVVDAEAIARRVSLNTGVPVHRMTASERDLLLHLEDQLHRRIIGQQAAIEAVAKAVRLGRQGLKQRPQMPTGSFLFLGPTGTGKTELAKALAELLFSDERALIRIDMTEFYGEHSVARLVGAPPGYVGFEQGGTLTEALKQKPYSVVLFDEVEKAEPSCLNILIQFLDDGRLTDGKGNTVDGSNTVVILTSNFAGPWIAQQHWKHGSVDKAELKQRLLRPDPAKGHPGFPPELLNRFDNFLVFHPLSPEHVRSIVDLQVKSLVRLLAEQGMDLQVDDRARDWIAREGYDPEMGARPVRRLIDRAIMDNLALALIEREPGGKKAVRVSAAESGIEVEVEQ